MLGIRTSYTELARGTNRLLLSCLASIRDYESPYWLTRKQCERLGGRVERDETNATVVYWIMIEKKECPRCENKDEKKLRKIEKSKYQCLICKKVFEATFPILRLHYVYNVQQCTGLQGKIPDVQKAKCTGSACAKAQGIYNCMASKPTWIEGGPRAYYRHQDDVIGIPDIKRGFNSPEDSAGTIIHELAHATGHKDRLMRKAITNLNTDTSQIDDYSKEELVAEITVCFFSQLLDMDLDFRNSVAYIKSWHKRLHENPQWIIVAAGAAQKACNYLVINYGTNVKKSNEGK